MLGANDFSVLLPCVSRTLAHDLRPCPVAHAVQRNIRIGNLIFAGTLSDTRTRGKKTAEKSKETRNRNGQCHGSPEHIRACTLAVWPRSTAS